MESTTRQTNPRSSAEIVKTVRLPGALEHKLKPPEISTLLSADEMGQINIPNGSAGDKEIFFKALKQLEQMGLVSSDYPPQERVYYFQRPMLTESGQLFLRQVLAAMSDKSG